MPYKTLISTEDTHQHLNNPQWRIVDCRYYLETPQRGVQEYSQAHVPGAVYADLGKDLSSPVVPGVTGRHPLPDVTTVSQRFGQWGIAEDIQVVVYDQGPGMIAARLWWMLRWLGHDAVAVMEGGWNKWLKEGKPVANEVSTPTPTPFSAKVKPELVAEAEEVAAAMQDADVKLLDARAADRFRGENETLDPVAGHIPGAISAPYMNLVDADGCLQPPEVLRKLYSNVLGNAPANRAIVYCGSGVTAALNILAMEHIGLGMARLYPGSWRRLRPAIPR